MLKECRQVAQVKGEPHRRWFHDDLFDLLVWFDDRNQPNGFELIHDSDDDPRALVLRPSGKLTYTAIDDGSNDPEQTYGMSRLLGPCVTFPRADLLREFIARSGNMERGIADYVRRSISGGSPC